MKHPLTLIKLRQSSHIFNNIILDLICGINIKWKYLGSVWNMLFVKLLLVIYLWTIVYIFGKHEMNVYCISSSLFNFSDNFNNSLMLNIYNIHVESMCMIW